MVVKIVTDSASDLPKSVAEMLKISVVPLCVRFGQETYRDRIDMSAEEFYKRLAEDQRHPATSTAPPNDFLEVWQTLLAEGADEIISITVSSKLSAVYGTALQAKEIMPEKDRAKIKIIDSKTVLMAQGFLVMLAARLAQNNKPAEEIMSLINENIPNARFLVILDTLKYIEKGGRATKALSNLKLTSALMGIIKPSLTIRDGEVHLSGLVKKHNRKRKIIEYMEKFPGIKAMALEYSPCLSGETKEIIDEIKAEAAASFANVPIYVSLASPVIGAHAGPGALGVSLIIDPCAVAINDLATEAVGI